MHPYICAQDASFDNGGAAHAIGYHVTGVCAPMYTFLTVMQHQKGSQEAPAPQAEMRSIPSASREGRPCSSGVLNPALSPRAHCSGPCGCTPGALACSPSTVSGTTSPPVPWRRSSSGLPRLSTFMTLGCTSHCARSPVLPRDPHWLHEKHGTSRLLMLQHVVWLLLACSHWDKLVLPALPVLRSTSQSPAGLPGDS